MVQKQSDPCYECLRCGGMWWKGIFSHDLGDIADFMSGGHKKPEYDVKTGLCPQGHGILTRARVEADPPFYLEKCSECNGIWFDKDEWLKISENQCENNLLNLWSVAWRKEQRLKREQQEMQEVYEQSLGADLYREIVAIAQKIKGHPQKGRALALLHEELK